MNEEITEDYIRGYRDGLISGNGMLNAKLHLIRMFIEELIDETTREKTLKQELR